MFPETVSFGFFFSDWCPIYFSHQTNVVKINKITEFCLITLHCQISDLSL